VLVERTRDGGRKILISGGGRCNVLPARLDESRFVTDSSRNTLRKLVRSWPLEEQITFFEREVGIPLVEETASSKLFPASQRARDVRDLLLALASRRGVGYLPDTLVTDLQPAAGGWRVLRERGGPLDADAVIVATGGLSVPSTGSDGRGLEVLARLGHVVHPTYPALTPLLGAAEPFSGLAGLSLPVDITAAADGWRATAAGGFLFTHRGYSGPAVLDVSHVVARARMTGQSAELSVGWGGVGAAGWEAALHSPGSRSVLAGIRALLPDRLARVLVEVAGVDPARPLAQLRRAERRALLDALTRYPLPCTGDEGYRKAEVTGGGVSLAQVDPVTLESRRHRRLYLCGELLDAFGPIGGYNFYWAWATGRLAGLGVVSA
jgi:predicted Rossmann fold flavoprotein